MCMAGRILLAVVLVADVLLLAILSFVTRINSDNLLLSGTFDRAAYSSGEVQRLVDDVGFSWEQARQVLLNGVKGSFSPGVDEDWISQYEQRLDEILP